MTELHRRDLVAAMTQLTAQIERGQKSSAREIFAVLAAGFQVIDANDHQWLVVALDLLRGCEAGASSELARAELRIAQMALWLMLRRRVAAAPDVISSQAG